MNKVRSIFLTLLLLYSPCFTFAQNLLQNPESVVFDSLFNRYLVTNSGSGNVVAIDSSGNQNYFLTGESCTGGTIIKDSVLYVACGYYGIKGFSLSNGTPVLDVPFPGTINTNDIAADSAGYIYVSHTPGNAIYKIDIRHQTYNIFVNTGLMFPNGLMYDHENNRLLLVSYRTNSPVQAINLSDSTVTTITGTSLDGLDGFAEDSQGNYYVSSWTSNSVYRFDHDFVNPPELYSVHNDAPADIGINKQGDILAVPLYYTDNIEFVSITFNQIRSETKITPENTTLLSSYPNPFNAKTHISFQLQTGGIVNLKIYDIAGREIAALVEGFKPVGAHSILFDAEGFSSGIYFARLMTSNKTQIVKIVYSR